ncbi:MAG: M43 family zinc metalloprotease [Flavobacteriales bacterium]
MKKTVLFFLWLTVSLSAWAQQPVNEKCGTIPSLEYRKQHDLFFINHKVPATRNASTGYDTSGYVIVPVVFHVVYLQSDSANQNIHDTIIWSQMDVLNEDFLRMNADAVNTLPIFDSIAVNTGIHFQLATFDPLGNPTNGITRTSTTTSHLLTPLTNSVKSNATGGKDPWPTDQYLNIWVCDMSFMGNPIVLGYAQFPGDNPATDGVVLQYNYVGATLDPGTAPNNLGRTATHESGHWFGMRHIWGDGGCGIDDGIMDTPDSDAASQTNCILTANNCDDAGNTFWGSLDPVDMVQNYMDYSEDGCMNAYTREQMHRMWYYIVNDRYDLFTSAGCGTSPLNGYAVSKRISCPGNCDGSATVYPVEGTAPFSYLWNDLLLQDSSTAVGLCKGMYTVRVIDADNDTIFMNAWVNGPDFLVPTIISVGTPCATCTTGSITVNANGGVPPYMYALNSGTPQASNQFTGLTPGNYLITVTDSCGNMFSDSVTVQNTIGINEIISESILQVAPNPAQHEINISVVNQGEFIQKVQLFNNIGQEVYQSVLNQQMNKFNIPVHQFENGMYVLTVQTTENTFQTKIIVKK